LQQRLNDADARLEAALEEARGEHAERMSAHAADSLVSRVAWPSRSCCNPPRSQPAFIIIILSGCATRCGRWKKARHSSSARIPVCQIFLCTHSRTPPSSCRRPDFFSVAHHLFPKPSTVSWPLSWNAGASQRRTHLHRREMWHQPSPRTTWPCCGNDLSWTPPKLTPGKSRRPSCGTSCRSRARRYAVSRRHHGVLEPSDHIQPLICHL
jgi:hypothetical protein